MKLIAKKNEIKWEMAEKKFLKIKKIIKTISTH